MHAGAGWLTRERLSALTLLAATAIALWLCYLLIRPFLAALAWALSFAVVAYPLHRALERGLKPGLAALLTCVVVSAALAGPVALVTRTLVMEAANGATVLKQETESGQWRAKLERNRWTRPIAGFIESRLDLGAVLERISGALAAAAKSAVSFSFSAALQFGIALFVLFFMLRDRAQALARLRSLLPMEHAEAEDVIRRVGEVVYATVFGRIAVAAVQGVVGGVAFALLGIPAPVVWGAVTFIMATIPILGAVVVWGPLALYLALSGSVVKGIVLTAVGASVISTVDNLLYPVLVGQKLRLHTVPVFFSLLGGIALTGASGVVIGPIILAVTDALLDLWCSRTSRGRGAEDIGLRPPAAWLS